jgi:hypothetical protein
MRRLLLASSPRILGELAATMSSGRTKGNRIYTRMAVELNMHRDRTHGSSLDFVRVLRVKTWHQRTHGGSTMRPPAWTTPGSRPARSRVTTLELSRGRSFVPWPDPEEW